MWPGERTAWLYPPLPPSFPPRCFNHIFNSNLLLFDPLGVAERRGRVFLAVLKAAGAAGGDRAGCCGRVELDGIPPPIFFFLLLLFAHLRAAAGLAPPSRRSPLFSLCRFPEQPGRGEAGRGRDQAGLDQSPLLLLAPPEPAELLRFSRGGTFRAPLGPGLRSRRRTPPWHRRNVRVPGPGLPEDALRQVKPSVRWSPTPGCLWSPRPAPGSAPAGREPQGTFKTC